MASLSSRSLSSWREENGRQKTEKVSAACVISLTSLTIHQEGNLGVPNSPPKARWLLSAILKSFTREDKAQGESFLSFHVSCACPSKTCPLPSPMNLWSSTAHLLRQRQLNSCSHSSDDTNLKSHSVLLDPSSKLTQERDCTQNTQECINLKECAKSWG